MAKASLLDGISLIDDPPKDELPPSRRRNRRKTDEPEKPKPAAETAEPVKAEPEAETPHKAAESSQKAKKGSDPPQPKKQKKRRQRASQAVPAPDYDPDPTNRQQLTVRLPYQQHEDLRALCLGFGNVDVRLSDGSRPSINDAAIQGLELWYRLRHKYPEQEAFEAAVDDILR